MSLFTVLVDSLSCCPFIFRSWVCCRDTVTVSVHQLALTPLASLLIVDKDDYNIHETTEKWSATSKYHFQGVSKFSGSRACRVAIDMLLDPNRYGYMTMSQCLDLAGDLKMGIYASWAILRISICQHSISLMAWYLSVEIPPRDMFMCQVMGTSMGAVINYIFIRSVIADKRAMLDGTVEDPTGQVSHPMFKCNWNW